MATAQAHLATRSKRTGSTGCSLTPAAMEAKLISAVGFALRSAKRCAASEAHAHLQKAMYSLVKKSQMLYVSPPKVIRLSELLGSDEEFGQQSHSVALPDVIDAQCQTETDMITRRQCEVMVQGCQDRFVELTHYVQDLRARLSRLESESADDVQNTTFSEAGLRSTWRDEVLHDVCSAVPKEVFELTHPTTASSHACPRSQQSDLELLR